MKIKFLKTVDKFLNIWKHQGFLNGYLFYMTIFKESWSRLVQSHIYTSKVVIQISRAWSRGLRGKLVARQARQRAHFK